jgi:hypothetical protein
LPAGLALALGGPRPIVVSGAGAEPPPGYRLDQLALTHQQWVSDIVTVPGGLLVLVFDSSLTVDPQAAWLVTGQDGRQVVRRIARGDVILLGQRKDRILVLHDPITSGEPSALQQISWTGQVLARQSVPDGLWLLADTARGLLAMRPHDVQPDSRAPFDLVLIDPDSAAVRSVLADRVGSDVTTTPDHPDHVAWIPYGCDVDCDLMVADLATGQVRTLPITTGFVVTDARFSPDGRRVAIAYSGRHPQQDGGAAPGFVELVDLATGTRTRIDGVATEIKQAATLAWTPDGQDLLLSVGFSDTDTRKVGYWTPGDSGVHVLPQTFAGGANGTALTPLVGVPGVVGQPARPGSLAGPGR